MTEDTVRQIREALAKATPGPWKAIEATTEHVWEGVYDANGMNVEDSWDNCQLVALLRNHAEELLSIAELHQGVLTELDQSEKELNRYKRALAVLRARVRHEWLQGNSFAGDDLEEAASILEGGDE